MTKHDAKEMLNLLDAISTALPDSYVWTDEMRERYENVVALLRAKIKP